MNYDEQHELVTYSDNEGHINMIYIGLEGEKNFKKLEIFNSKEKTEIPILIQYSTRLSALVAIYSSG